MYIRRIMYFVLCFLLVLILCYAQNSIAEDTIKWRMVSTWPEGAEFLIAPDKRFAERVSEMSNGKLKIDLYGAGELCSASEVLDTVSSGGVEAGGDWPSYWSGKNTAFDLLGSHSMGFTAEDYLLWIYAGNGLEFYEELYGNYNCVYFPHTISHMESGIRTNKPVDSLEDLKGLKIRMAGLLPGKILEELGGSPTSISVGELYEALRRGTIDGAEYSAPVNAREFHIEEVCKYWLAPGWHQTSSVYGVIINKDAFNDLPNHLQEVVKSAAKDTLVTRTAMYAYHDALATQYFLDSDVNITTLSDEELNKIERISNDIQENLAKENDDYARVLKSQIEYLKMFEAYRDASGEFGFGRNKSEYPDIE